MSTSTFNTTCTAIPNLTGSIEVDSGKVKSYTSNSTTGLGVTSTDIKDLGGSDSLHFKVTFKFGPGGKDEAPYKVKANLSGSDYNGSAEPDAKRKGNYGDYEDTWAATAVQEPAAAAKGAS
jgi:hypothetical protein